MSGERRFYFDVIRHDNERVPLEIYSMVGLVPLFAATVVEPSTLAQLPVVMQTVGNVLNSRQFLRSIIASFVEPGVNGRRLFAVVDRDRLAAILQHVLDETRFVSDYGVRSLRASIEIGRSPSLSAGNNTRSHIRRASPTIGCLVATRTGAARSGFR